MTARDGTGSAGAAALKAWTEWRKRCALALCSRAAQAGLEAFAGVRFRALLRKCGGPATACAAPAARDAWHLFETHLTVRSTAGGKRYKDWLFARVPRGGSAQDSVDAVQGGAWLLMRDVVREHLRREIAPPNTVSLQAPLQPGDATPLTLEDLLPGEDDPARCVERREYESLARQHAEELFADLTDRERVAILAKTLNLSLAHKAVVRAAGCGKSALNDAFRAFLQAVAARLRARYADDEAESVLRLTLLTLAELKGRAFLWGKSENGCPELFLYSRGQRGLGNEEAAQNHEAGAVGAAARATGAVARGMAD